MSRLDTDNMAGISAATRQLDADREYLQDMINAQRDGTSAGVSGKTKDQILLALAAFGINPPASTPKADLVASYVKAVAGNSEEGQRLAELTAAARRDRYFADQINRVLDDAETAAAQLASEVAAEASRPGMVTFRIVALVDGVQMAQGAAYWASHLITSVDEYGKDIRDAALTVTKEAMREVLGFPRRVFSCGTGTARNMEETAKAAGAAAFLKDAGAFLPDGLASDLLFG